MPKHQAPLPEVEFRTRIVMITSAPDFMKREIGRTGKLIGVTGRGLCRVVLSDGTCVILAGSRLIPIDDHKPDAADRLIVNEYRQEHK